MMKENKINIELIVPSIGEKYSVFIPVNKTVGEVITILNKLINEMTGYFSINNKTCLINTTNGVIYQYNIEIKKAGIQNGSTIALI